jgi:hypothetical protein
MSCQQGVAAAAGVLTTSARRLLGRCVALGSACLDDPETKDSCCTAAAPTCDQNMDLLDDAVAAFAAQVRQACLGISFDRLMDSSGLGYDYMVPACDRLEPPVEVKNRKKLGTCLGRLLVEDVVHELTGTEQPRALDALLCMGVTDAVPGVSRDDPATCVARGGSPPPSPTPSPRPGPTPSGGGATPGGGSSPTPQGPTPAPTQGPACSSVEVTLTTSFTQTDVFGVSGRLNYPTSVDLPGFLDNDQVLARVTNLTGVNGLFGVSDQDDPPPPFLNFGLTSGGQPIPAGPFVSVRFDCVGSGAVEASQFSCDDFAVATFSGSEQSPCSLSVSVQP